MFDPRSFYTGESSGTGETVYAPWICVQVSESSSTVLVVPDQTTVLTETPREYV